MGDCGIMKSFIIYTLHQTLLGWSVQVRDGWDMYYIWQGSEMHTILLLLKSLMEDLGIDGRIILNLILKMNGSRMLSTFIWLRVRTTGRPL
jgi:hypothetical protein